MFFVFFLLRVDISVDLIFYLSVCPFAFSWIYLTAYDMDIDSSFSSHYSPRYPVSYASPSRPCSPPFRVRIRFRNHECYPLATFSRCSPSPSVKSEPEVQAWVRAYHRACARAGDITAMGTMGTVRTQQSSLLAHAYASSTPTDRDGAPYHRSEFARSSSSVRVSVDAIRRTKVRKQPSVSMRQRLRSQTGDREENLRGAGGDARQLME